MTTKVKYFLELHKIYPMANMRFPSWAVRLSDWIDDTFFPLPKTTRDQDLQALFARQAKIEDAATFISQQIKSCRKLRHTYAIVDMIGNFRKLYGQTTQGAASADSLHLANYNKQKEILNQL